MIYIYLIRYPAHEHEIGKIALEMGFTHVSLSSATMPMARIVPRAFTGERDPCMLFQVYWCNLVASFCYTNEFASIFALNPGGFTGLASLDVRWLAQQLGC